MGGAASSSGAALNNNNAISPRTAPQHRCRMALLSSRLDRHESEQTAVRQASAIWQFSPATNWGFGRAQKFVIHRTSRLRLRRVRAPARYNQTKQLSVRWLGTVITIGDNDV